MLYHSGDEYACVQADGGVCSNFLLTQSHGPLIMSDCKTKEPQNIILFISNLLPKALSYLMKPGINV